MCGALPKGEFSTHESKMLCIYSMTDTVCGAEAKENNYFLQVQSKFRVTFRQKFKVLSDAIVVG